MHCWNRPGGIEVNFLSAALPPRQRVAGYRSAMHDYFCSFGREVGVELDVDDPELFSAEIELMAIGQLFGAIHRSNSPHRVYASPTGSDDLDFYLVCAGDISLCGHHGGAEICLQAGDMILWPAGAGFQARSNRIEMIALGLPEAVAGHWVSEHGCIAGRRIASCNALGCCVAALLRTAAQHHRQFVPAEGAVLQTAIVDAIRLLAADDDRATETRAAQRRQTQLSRLKPLALRALERPDLDAGVLAREAGVSSRTVHRLFTASGTTFRAWLRERRLERCWLALTAPGRGRDTIATVAFGCGFNDLSTFNRAFRARFGVTPQAARQASRIGQR